MKNPKPTIRVNVDLTNPGQFFACCGLLELADRLWPGAEGWFEENSFCVLCDGTDCSQEHLIDKFSNSLVSQIDPDDKAASRLQLGEPFNIRLDWWYKLEGPSKTEVDLGGGEKLKPWAGKQFGPVIFTEMKKACKDITFNRLWDNPKAVYNTKNNKAKKTLSPFYFDSRREETALDIGFSPDEQKMSVMAYPAVESLALVGLQRFRPLLDKQNNKRSFLYTAWSTQLPIVAAAVVVSGMIPTQSIGIFRFTKPSRGGEYLTMFSRAKRERNTNV